MLLPTAERKPSGTRSCCRVIEDDVVESELIDILKAISPSGDTHRNRPDKSPEEIERMEAERELFLNMTF